MRELNQNEIDEVSGGLGEYGPMTNNGITGFNEKMFNMGMHISRPTYFMPTLWGRSGFSSGSSAGGGAGSGAGGGVPIFTPEITDVEI